MFSFKKATTSYPDFDFIADDDAGQRAYLKRMALDAGVNFIARRLAQATFKHKKNGKFLQDEVWYKLNARPNQNQTKTQFWEKAMHELLYESECLIVSTDTGDLLVADSFVHNDQYAVYEDRFKGVSVNGYTFQRDFAMSDVIYLNYQNPRLSAYTDSLFQDYGAMLGRMISANMRNHQIRSTLSMDAMDNMKDGQRNALQKYIDKIFQAFSKKDVAIVPVLRGMEYNELTNSSNTTKSQSFTDISDLRKDAIKTVADILGIPEVLLTETTSDVSNTESFFDNGTLSYFYGLISDELNAKLVSSYAYRKGERIEIVGRNAPDMFRLADTIDKLVSSGTVTRNEIRERLGLEKGGSELDEFYITKNYERG